MPNILGIQDAIILHYTHTKILVLVPQSKSILQLSRLLDWWILQMHETQK